VVAPLTVNAAELPSQIVVLELAVITGFVFTATLICFADEQPLLVPVTV
jgi:hypothetical protein